MQISTAMPFIDRKFADALFGSSDIGSYEVGCSKMMSAAAREKLGSFGIWNKESSGNDDDLSTGCRRVLQ
jgi:hypothetical protein